MVFVKVVTACFSEDIKGCLEQLDILDVIYYKFAHYMVDLGRKS